MPVVDARVETETLASLVSRLAVSMACLAASSSREPDRAWEETTARVVVEPARPPANANANASSSAPAHRVTLDAVPGVGLADDDAVRAFIARAFRGDRRAKAQASGFELVTAVASARDVRAHSWRTAPAEPTRADGDDAATPRATLDAWAIADDVVIASKSSRFWRPAHEGTSVSFTWTPLAAAAGGGGDGGGDGDASPLREIPSALRATASLLPEGSEITLTMPSSGGPPTIVSFGHRAPPPPVARTAGGGGGGGARPGEDETLDRRPPPRRECTLRGSARASRNDGAWTVECAVTLARVDETERGADVPGRTRVAVNGAFLTAAEAFLVAQQALVKPAPWWDEHNLPPVVRGFKPGLLSDDRNGVIGDAMGDGGAFLAFHSSPVAAATAPPAAADGERNVRRRVDGGDGEGRDDDGDDDEIDDAMYATFPRHVYRVDEIVVHLRRESLFDVGLRDAAGDGGETDAAAADGNASPGAALRVELFDTGNGANRFSMGIVKLINAALDEALKTAKNIDRVAFISPQERKKMENCDAVAAAVVAVLKRGGSEDVADFFRDVRTAHGETFNWEEEYKWRLFETTFE